MRHRQHTFTLKAVERCRDLRRHAWSSSRKPGGYIRMKSRVEPTLIRDSMRNVIDVRQAPLLLRLSRRLDDRPSVDRIIRQQSMQQRRPVIRRLNRHITDIDDPWEVITHKRGASSRPSVAFHLRGYRNFYDRDREPTSTCPRASTSS